MKTGRHLQRLAALEQTSAARLPRNDQITLGEWRRWHETGQQPQRWIGNASIQEWVQQALERQRQADETIALFEVAEYEADSAPIAGA